MNELTTFLVLIIMFLVLLWVNRFFHEMAHFVSLRLFGINCRFPSFGFFSFKKGGRVQLTKVEEKKFLKLSKGKQRIVHLAGITANIVVYYFTFRLVHYYFIPTTFWVLLAFLVTGTFIFLVVPDIVCRKSDFWYFMETYR